jgi:hypothetical protein
MFEEFLSTVFSKSTPGLSENGRGANPIRVINFLGLPALSVTCGYQRECARRSSSSAVRSPSPCYFDWAIASTRKRACIALFQARLRNLRLPSRCKPSRPARHRRRQPIPVRCHRSAASDRDRPQRPLAPQPRVLQEASPQFAGRELRDLLQERSPKAEF